MIGRFEGSDGKRRLVEILCSHELLGGDSAIAEQIADAASLKELAVGEVLIDQGDSDNAIHFICAGSVRIIINGREVAVRRVRECVGEMALIDPSAPRAATVIAAETTVVAQVDEGTFAKIADASPQIWRGLARIMTARLRQRGELVRPMNSVPNVFIGGSTEALLVGRHLQSALRYDNLVAEVWTDDVFQASRYPLEDLQRQVEKSDFAVLVLSPDDKVTSRATEFDAPRDNVIFELGLFFGVLGRDRTFLVVPRGLHLKIPSDVAGLTPIEYQTGDDATLTGRLAPVAHQIRQAVLQKGAR